MTLIPVTGSVHEEAELVELVELVVVHTTAVLVGAAWLHETTLNSTISNARQERSLTAHRS